MQTSCLFKISNAGVIFTLFFFFVVFFQINCFKNISESSDYQTASLEPYQAISDNLSGLILVQTVSKGLISRWCQQTRLKCSIWPNYAFKSIDLFYKHQTKHNSIIFQTNWETQNSRNVQLYNNLQNILRTGSKFISTLSKILITKLLLMTFQQRTMC